MIHITDSYLSSDSVFLFSSRLSLLSIICHLRSFPFLPLGVCGFSFGSVVLAPFGEWTKFSLLDHR